MERCSALLIVDVEIINRASQVSRQRITVSEEGSAEWLVIAQAYRCRDSEVGHQLHILAAVAVGATVDIPVE